VLVRLFDRSIGVVSTTLLARLLVPADFGLVAMAMSVIAIIELATAFSFEVALIQKQDVTREHYDTVWTLNLMLAAGGAAITSALAYPAAAFYGDPRLAPVMFAISAAWLVSGLENVGTVNFRREMNFAAEFRFMCSKRVIGFVVTLTAALLFRSYWALVIGAASGRVAGVALSYAMQAFRPRLSLRHTRELFSFSGWLLVNNIASVVIGRLPHFFVGRLFGAPALGTYTIGSEIAQLAHTELAAPINRAMFPGYARLVREPEKFRKVVVEATAAILLVVLPVSVGIAALAAPLVRLLLGAQWGGTVPVIQTLAFCGAVSALTSNNVAAYMALGRPHLVTVFIVVRLGLLGLFMALLVPGRPLITVAYAEFLAALGCFVVSLPLLFSAIGLRTREYLASLWRPLVASALMGGALFAIGGALPHRAELGDALVQLVVGVPAGAAIYLATLWTLWHAAGRPECVEATVASSALGAVAGVFRRATP